MHPSNAAEHLQTIRTLMERSALYRRALAPVMILAGVIGLLAAVAGVMLAIESEPVFIAYWLGVALTGLAGAFLLMRRQALQSQEPFWSPPTRRVAAALLPGLAAGALVGIWFFIVCARPLPADPPTGMAEDRTFVVWLIALWAILYGCALHAAGFFTPRGLRWFGWLFIIVGGGILLSLAVRSGPDVPLAGPRLVHGIMGGLFGLLHLAYGIYLYLSEARKSAA
jgi:hypothetical protein